MGCCYSFFCKNDSSSQSDEANERTHLLVDPVSNNLNIQRSNSDAFLSSSASSVPRKTDEQSALNKILQETATNVIDVAALDTHNLQQHEYAERMKTYNHRVQQVCTHSRANLLNKMKICILNDVPNVEKVLCTDPIAPSDVDIVSSAISKAVNAVGDIRIEHKEELVVPFHIPG